ncbi:SIS domain-containing protein [Salinicola sp. 4072]|uniref:SIS domain-containing protein n=1 Tax=Salinicola sp. 4072 TaxID=3082157 RepID=UPI002FC623E7
MKSTLASESLHPSIRERSIELARTVFDDQSRALKEIGQLLESDFHEAVELIYGCTGKVIVSGMGKSGIIGRKIAATLASTGTPSFFVHPGEAYHGDLGMIGSDDLVILISYSGETDEPGLFMRPARKRR